MTTHISSRDWEILSAYLDGELSPKELQALEARLRTRGDLRAALEELRRTRAVVRSHLPMRAPRNFTLTPAMAGMPAPRRPAGGLFPAYRLASALSSFLFLLVVVGEFLFARQASAPLMAAEPGLEMAAVATQAFAESPAEAEPELQARQAAAPTPLEIAKALEAGNLTAEAPLPALEELVLTATAQVPPEGVGMGGGSAEEQQDQAALSAMQAVPTATPLPTPTLTPTPTPEPPSAPQDVGAQEARARAPLRFNWRWLEITLAIIGATTGLIAFYLYRSGRA